MSEKFFIVQGDSISMSDIQALLEIQSVGLSYLDAIKKLNRRPVHDLAFKLFSDGNCFGVDTDCSELIAALHKEMPEAFKAEFDELRKRLSARDEKSNAHSDSIEFFNELTASVESLAGISEEHGAQTLADLMWLHAAIHAATSDSSFISIFDKNSAAIKIVENLPSSDKWMKFIDCDSSDMKMPLGH